MVELGGWFKEGFWTGAGTDGRMNTKLITKQLESYLPADSAREVPQRHVRGIPGGRVLARWPYRSVIGKIAIPNTASAVRGKSG
jgi:hypothetical protein